MTTANNSAAGDGILAKKVKSASFDISLYPHFEGLSGFIGKKSAALLSASARIAALPRDPAASMETLQKTQDALPENVAAYWYGDGADGHALLICLSPKFLAALSEALLGGAFVEPEEAPAPTALDTELAQVFVNAMVKDIDVRLLEALSPSNSGALTLTRSTITRKSIFKDVLVSAFFKLDITFKFENEDFQSAMALYFPVEYLERRGLLAQIRKSALGTNTNTKWHADMLENVRHLEIELPVMIGNYKMTLSDLSRLEVGQFIPLEEGAHNALDVTLKTDKGVVTICQGQLGTFKKNKAAKVVSGVGGA